MHPLNRLLEEFFGEVLHGDAVCYTLKASVLPNSRYLVAGVLLNSFVVSLVLRFAHCAVNERIARSQMTTRSMTTTNHALVESTIAKTIFQLPIGAIFFGSVDALSSLIENNANNAEEE